MNENNNILPRGIVITQFIKDANEMNDDALAARYEVSHRTLRRWKQKIRESENDIITTAFPESPSPQYTDYLKLEYENCCIIGDAEIPDHDPVLFNMAAQLADKLGLEHLIIAGDFVALDSFSAWPKDNPQSTSFERDLDLAMTSIKVFLNTFDTVDYIIGNHERRLAKQNKGQNNMGLYMRHIFGLQYSNYPYCELISGGKEILICHPEDYSRVQLAVPRRLATVYDKNIICGHLHSQEMGYSDNAKYFIASLGHMRDETRTMYKCMKIASNPKWRQGFGIVISGNLFLINKENFAFWMRCVDLGR
jgi:predicted phosphodiesterase